MLARVGARSSRLHMSQLDGSPLKPRRASSPHKRRACLALISTTHESALHEGRKPRIALRGPPRLQSNNCSRDELTSPTARLQQISGISESPERLHLLEHKGQGPKHPILSAPPPRGGQSFISLIAPSTTVVIMCSRDELTMSTPEGRARPQPWGESPRYARGPPHIDPPPPA